MKVARASLVKKTLENLEAEWKRLTDEIAEMEKNLGPSELEEDREMEQLEREIRKIDREMEKRFGSYGKVKEREKLRERLISLEQKFSYNEREIANLRDLMSSLSSLESRTNAISFLRSQAINGIFGTVGELIKFPAEYKLAMKTALGDHVNDIVVDSRQTAVTAIKMLRSARVGRARFIPLDSIKGRDAKQLTDAGFLGNAIDVAKFSSKYFPAMKYVFGDTAIFDNIDNAKHAAGKARIVTLDGDLIERSGAMVGGFMKRDSQQPISRYTRRVEELEKENQTLEKEISSLKEKLSKMEKAEEKESREMEEAQKRKAELEKRLEELRKERRGKYEQRLRLQQEVNKKRVQRARIEGRIDNEKIKLAEYRDVKEFMDKPEEELEHMIGSLVRQINSLGPVNLRAIDDWKSVNTEFFQLKEKLEKLLDERDRVLKAAEEINKKRYSKFMDTMNEIGERFSRIYHDLTGGDGKLGLEEEDNIDSGLVIYATPRGKKVTNIDMLSGGEKTLAALAFLFAIQSENSLFYVLDEVDAALDKANTLKIAELIKKYSEKYQFIVISHNDTTVSMADEVFGVTMEDGKSKVLSIKLPGA